MEWIGFLEYSNVMCVEWKSKTSEYNMQKRHHVEVIKRTI